MSAAISIPMRDIAPPPYIADMIQISSYAEVTEVLRSGDFIQGAHRQSKPFFGDSLVTLDGPRHFGRRRLESRLFTRDALLYYEKDVLKPAIERSLADLDREDGAAVGDLPILARRMLLEMTAQIAGIDGVNTEESTERFHHVVEKLSEGSTVEWSTRDHDEVIREVLAVRDVFVRKFYDPSLRRRQDLVRRHRRGDVEDSELPRDLLTLLVLQRDPDWDPELPLRETTNYLVAGTQTTTHALPHVVNHLLGWLAEHPEDAAKATELEFLQRATYETLRLHLPAPSLLRIATRDVVLSTGRAIPEGARIALLFTPANRDPEIFGANAAEFDPTRQIEPPAKPWGLAFGSGRKTCIGRQLVTGLSKTFDDLGDDELVTAGITTQILQALFAAGVERDPERLPQFRAISHHDAFDSYPVRFRKL